MLDSPLITGLHLIAGTWVASEDFFASDPVTGGEQVFYAGGPDEVNEAVTAAVAAYPTYSRTTREARAAFLEKIADEIELRGPQLTEIAGSETGLPAARLEGERGRTCGQLRLFAALIRSGDYLDRRHDVALPERSPLPRPDLRLMQRPVGPVGVFGASNFPLAFSTAGGDTASALAAGCPVVYKGHPGHPGTCEIVAGAIDAAIKACGMPAGTFSMVQSATNDAGAALVTHPGIKAVGFTGSYTGGKALFDLAMSRSEPIPFFGELGSLNPVFVMAEALAARATELGEGWAGSLTMGVGQFCTNPSLVILPEGADGDQFAEAAVAALAGVAPQPMLTAGTAEAYLGGVQMLAGAGLSQLTAAQSCSAREGAPAVFGVSASEWLKRPELAKEVFGPAGILIRTASPDETAKVARGLHGQLTATILMDDGDTDAVRPLVPILEDKAGRLLFNGFPTGVEVADSMVHGGPFPASTNFGATSVGTMAIRRFLRPVCYQNMPSALMSDDLRDME